MVEQSSTCPASTLTVTEVTLTALLFVRYVTCATSCNNGPLEDHIYALGPPLTTTTQLQPVLCIIFHYVMRILREQSLFSAILQSIFLNIVFIIVSSEGAELQGLRALSHELGHHLGLLSHYRSMR